jgi:hypothetical protein
MSADCAAIGDAIAFDKRPHRGRREVEGQRIDVAKHRSRTAAGNGPPRGEERVRGRHHLVAGTDFERHERQQQGIRAG